MTSKATWALAGMTHDEQSITSDWQIVRDQRIDGVVVHEVRNVLTSYGVLTEVYRGDWKLDEHSVDQVFQSMLEPGGVSAWHVHAVTTDRLFVNMGRLKIVLYDARQDSRTCGQLQVFHYGAVRPAMVVIPPGVWHGVQNVSSQTASLLNVVDHAYRYEEPDHYRLPSDTQEIPYRFAAIGKDALGRG